MDRPVRVALYARVSTGGPDFHLQVETQFIILREHARAIGAEVHRDTPTSNRAPRTFPRYRR